MTGDTPHDTDVRLSVVEERVRIMEKIVEELKCTMSGMNAKLTAILVSVATAALLLAIDLVVRGIAQP